MLLEFPTDSIKIKFCYKNADSGREQAAHQAYGSRQKCRANESLTDDTAALGFYQCQLPHEVSTESEQHVVIHHAEDFTGSIRR